jgi:putative hydrolase of the HAD superfamily
MAANPRKTVAAVTLDAGGTLLHPYPSVGEVYSEVLERYGIIVDPDLLERCFRKAFRAAGSERSAEVSDESEWRFWRTVVQETLEGHCPSDYFETIFEDLYCEFGTGQRWKLAEDALPTIKSLKGRGYLVGILSNWDRRLSQVLKELQVEPLLDACFISSEIGFEKPDLRIFRHVEGALGLEPVQILHVGDSREHDAEGARRAGWNYLLVQNGAAASTRDDHVIPELNQILHLLT